MSDGRRELRTPPHYALAATCSPLRLGRGDPAVRLAADELGWASRTPDGPGTLHLSQRGDRLTARAYGAGAGWLLERADALAGLRDDLTGFDELAAGHPVVRRAWHRHPGLRLTRTGRLFQHLVPTVIGQKVTGKEAAHGYARTVRHFGEPAPGPLPDLLLPPDPERVAATPYWVFHPLGIERKRADTLCRAAAVARSLEAAPDAVTASARLQALPGIGPWTAAEVVRLTFGDPDAVSVGDWNIPHHVVYAMTGEVRAGSRDSAPGRLSGADTRLLEVLEPFAGHRGRVCQVVMADSPAPPRFGPRLPVRSFARF